MDLNRSIQQKMAGNALSGMIATGIYLVSRLILTPFILNYLTLAEFGLWSLCFIILSYASMGGFGINSTYIRYTARYLAEGRQSEIGRLLSTGIACMLVFSLFFILLLYLFMPLIHDIFQIDKAQQSIATPIFLGTAVVFSLELTLGGFRFIINGLHEIAKEKTITTFAGLAEVAAIIAFLLFGTGIMGLLYAYALRVILETWSCGLLIRRLLPGIRLSPRLINHEHFRLFFVFGGKVQALGAVGIFLNALDRIFVTAISGLAAVGMFEIGRKLPFTAKKISESAFGPFLPTAAHLDASWEKESHDSPAKRSRNYVHIALFMFIAGSVPALFLPSVNRMLPIPAESAAPLLAVVSIVLFIPLRKKHRHGEQLSKGELRMLYLNGLRYTNLVSITTFAFLIAAATPLINAWVGTGYNEAIILMVFISLAYTMQLSTGPGNLIFRGIDRNGREFEYLLAQLVLVLLWLPSATASYGLAGAAGALAAASSASAIFFFWRSNFTFQISLKELTRHAIIPALVPLIPAAGIYITTLTLPSGGRIETIMIVLGYGILYITVTLTILWYTVLNADEKQRAADLLPVFSASKRKS